MFASLVQLLNRNLSSFFFFYLSPGIIFKEMLGVHIFIILLQFGNASWVIRKVLNYNFVPDVLSCTSWKDSSGCACAYLTVFHLTWRDQCLKFLYWSKSLLLYNCVCSVKQLEWSRWILCQLLFSSCIITRQLPRLWFDCVSLNGFINTHKYFHCSSNNRDVLWI